MALFPWRSRDPRFTSQLHSYASFHALLHFMDIYYTGYIRSSEKNKKETKKPGEARVKGGYSDISRSGMYWHKGILDEIFVEA